MRYSDRKTIIYDLEEVSEVAKLLLEKSDHKRVWLFDAPMGGGKTTLIKELCLALGVTEETSSPTFAIVNEYHTSDDEPLYHIDAYRLEREQDGFNIGIGEYIDSGAYCFIEWPGVLGETVRDDAFVIRITPINEREREITLLAESAPLLYDHQR